VVQASVAVLAILRQASFVVHGEALLVTTMASPFGAQEPESEVADPEVPVETEVERRPSAKGMLPDITLALYLRWTMSLPRHVSRVISLMLLLPHGLRSLWLGLKFLHSVPLRGGEGLIAILVTLVLLPSTVVSVGRGMPCAFKIVLYFFCCVCMTGWPECGLGCDSDLACGRG